MTVASATKVRMQKHPHQHNQQGAESVPHGLLALPASWRGLLSTVRLGEQTVPLVLVSGVSIRFNPDYVWR